jgi:two-component system cell cycle response regulator
MDMIDQVKERLSIFKNLYDVIRIVNPVKKTNIIIEDNKIQEINGTCYALWTKNSICENCISMRAYINNDTFVKIEYDKEKIVLITATPVEIEGNKFIVEILKDITQNGSALHKLTESSDSVEELISSMNEKVIKDELTGLYNRRYINERLFMDINYRRVSKRPLSVVMADIDFFKKVNDKYGHVIGDKVLIDFSNLILRFIINNSDWAGRYGGEEFIIVLNNTDLKNAYIITEKIRKQLENTTLNYDDININITASFGIYSISDYDINITELLSKVDKNLYKAKASGRNRIIMSLENESENEVGGVNINQKSVKLSKLNEQINEVREILNEVCCTLDSDEAKTDRLIISQYLDELIVEYMKELNDLK